MFLIVYALCLVLLGAFWLTGEAEFRTKVIFTLIYLASGLLGLVDSWALVVGQGVLALILWWMTFGPSRR